MNAPKRARKKSKKLFTVAQANAMLPLLRAILRDVTELAREMGERQERLSRVAQPARGATVPHGPSDPHREEIEEVEAESERGRERMVELVGELQALGVELKDPYIGLIDFPAIMDGHEVYLCW